MKDALSFDLRLTPQQGKAFEWAVKVVAPPAQTVSSAQPCTARLHACATARNLQRLLALLGKGSKSQGDTELGLKSRRRRRLPLSLSLPASDRGQPPVFIGLELRCHLHED